MMQGRRPDGPFVGLFLRRPSPLEPGTSPPLMQDSCTVSVGTSTTINQSMADSENVCTSCGCTWTRRGLFILIIGLLVLIAVLLGAVIFEAIAINALTKNLDKRPEGRVYHNCASCACEELQSPLGPDAECKDDYNRSLANRKMVAQQEGAQLCCMDESGLLVKHYEKESKKRREERDMKREQCGQPTIVNLPDTAEYYTESQVNSDGFQTISEYRPMESGEFVDRISIDNHGHVVVNMRGEYQIGARVSFFRPACHRSPCTKFETRLVRENRHYDYRREPFVLQEDIQTEECKEEKCWMRHISVINGTFSLQQRDEIYLNVTKRDLLELGGHTFLVIRLADDQKPDPKITSG